MPVSSLSDVVFAQISLLLLTHDSVVVLQPATKVRSAMITISLYFFAELSAVV